MADITKNVPQVVAPVPEGLKNKPARTPPGSALIEGGKIVRKFVDENLLKTRKAHGGIR
jgi:hypothetical protein